MGRLLAGSADTPTYVVVLDSGDEAMAVLSGIAADKQLTGAQVTAVGALERAVMEVIIRETHAGLRKACRPEVGLALIDLDE